MKRRSFSFLLARRYLNPRRAMLSSFTLISLIGVMLGVLVLVVVMAVFAGLERNVKQRVLGFTPHILLRSGGAAAFGLPMADWREQAVRARKLPGVVSATPYIADNALIDIGRQPVMFHGVDTKDPAQVDGITRMLDLEKFPNSSADMGLDDRVVISSMLAKRVGLGVGDRVRIISARNLDELMATYEAVEQGPVREAHAEPWQKATAALAAAWKPANGGFTLPQAVAESDVCVPLEMIADEKIRRPEQELLLEIINTLRDAEVDPVTKMLHFDKDTKVAIDGRVADLNTTDPEKMDADLLKGLKSFVLPKEAEVIGVYQASQMAITPDIFMPLPLAQGLVGMDDEVQGIALRLADPYQAEAVAAAGRAELGPEWSLLTWGDQYQAFFSLINQQRVMMYFALSFIVLVSAFSMMAVMFTVTIQKRREIGVMKALGAAPGQIVWVFLYQGMILGVLGAILGVVLGRVVIHFRGRIQQLFQAVGFDPFSADFLGGGLPAYNDPKEQAVIALCAFVLCSLAALVPAFFAARSDAAKSLRNL